MIYLAQVDRRTDRQTDRQTYNVITIWLAVRLSGNALVSINVVTLRRARLVPGWVTAFERINYLGM